MAAALSLAVWRAVRYQAQQLTSLRALQAGVIQAPCHLHRCGRRAHAAAAGSSACAAAAASAGAAAASSSDVDARPAPPSSEEELEPGLYVVSTPIGNLEDMTLRALRVLRSATMVLAEDTRHTRQLFSHFGIRTPLHSFHQHNERQKEALVLRQLQQGAAIALVSDAGTPAINDPGAALVAAAAAAGLPVIPVPGASALLAAVVAAGLPSDRFLFCGFTAAKGSARRKQLAGLAAQEATLVFYVSPHSLLAALEDAAAAFGGQRRCCLARELTKRHEEFWRGSLAEALAEFQGREGGPRGEFVLLVEGAPAGSAAAGGAAGAAGEGGEEAVAAALRAAMAAGESPSAAAKSVAQRLGVSRKVAYALSLQLSEAQQESEQPC